MKKLDPALHNLKWHVQNVHLSLEEQQWSAAQCFHIDWESYCANSSLHNPLQHCAFVCACNSTESMPPPAPSLAWIWSTRLSPTFPTGLFGYWLLHHWNKWVKICLKPTVALSSLMLIVCSWAHNETKIHICDKCESLSHTLIWFNCVVTRNEEENGFA